MSSGPHLNRRGLLASLPALAGAPAALHADDDDFEPAAPTSGIVGQLAPELPVSYWLDASGQRGDFKVLANRDKMVVLKFWQAWCPGCHERGLPALQIMSQALAENPHIAFAAVQTTFEGFDTNTQDKVAEIQSRYHLNMPVGHADAGSGGEHLPPVMHRYRSGGTPWFVLIAPGGEVLYDGFHLDAERFLSWFADTPLAT